MILPIAMALIPISALTILMYAGDLGSRLDLVQLTPSQYALSVLSGLVIIPVVEGIKILLRKSDRKSIFPRGFGPN
jgi:hypothetical protein